MSYHLYYDRSSKYARLLPLPAERIHVHGRPLASGIPFLRGTMTGWFDSGLRTLRLKQRFHVERAFHKGESRWRIGRMYS
jgi:hypothetical protein